MNFRDKRLAMATNDPRAINNFYKQRPQLREIFLVVADGNEEALKILERLGVFSLRYPHIDISKFNDLGIFGYRIELLYRAVGKDLNKLSAATISNNQMVSLLKHIETIKYKTLPDYDNVRVQMLLKEYDIRNLDELFDNLNVKAWKAILCWKMLIPLFENNGILENALFNFLIPDNVDCTQWFINYLSLKDWNDRLDFEEYLSEDIKYFCDELSVRAYPLWYIAAYPTVVKWISNIEPKKWQLFFETEIFQIIMEEFDTMQFESETFNQNRPFSQSTLRLIHQAYIKNHP